MTTLSSLRNALLMIAFLVICNQLSAQTFGRNKPRYTKQDFEVLETPHFHIHHYLENDSLLHEVGKMSERWYEYHQDVTHDTFHHHNPLILYNNHADFQQTNAISGNIGIGTGGVTEGFKNRVVMPFTFSNQNTNHVLGHELVHAFQYHMVINGDSTSIRNMGNMPLWFVEGLAEYMSLGRIDPFTAMWMRDAVVRDDVPTLGEMNSPKYFPYRYGQAFWSFIGGTYGDDIIEPLFMNAAKYGMAAAIPMTLEVSVENLSNMWQSALKNYFTPFVDNAVKDPRGKPLLSKENSGRINVSPSLSPNGKYVIFLSEKDLFSTDLFVADARTGDIVSKLVSLTKDGGLDHLNLLESTGAWSPNGREYAVIAFKKGKNILIIKDVESGKTQKTYEIDEVPAFSYPTWSPDGKKIVVTGLVQGQVDLYQFDLKSEKVTQLTDDIYSEVMSSYSPDGQSLLFSYDKDAVNNGSTYGTYTYDIAEMNLSDRTIEVFDFFSGVQNLNPVYDHEGNIYFISERDGYRNLYRYKRAEDQLYQMTNLATGISGISRLSPALTTSTKKDRVIYTHYTDNSYNIIRSSSDKLLNKPVDKQSINRAAGTLPVLGLNKTDIVHDNLSKQDKWTYRGATFVDKDYSANFKLDYIGGGVGVGVNNNNNVANATNLQGGIGFLFSDMLGNHQLFTQFSLNGEILDAGGQVSYINRKNRLAWGAGLSHVPLRTGYSRLYEGPQFTTFDNQTIAANVKQELNVIRVFDESLNLFVHYPFSTTLRLEGGVAGQYRSFRYDRYNEYYRFVNGLGYQRIYDERQKQETGDEIQLNQYYTLAKGTGANINIGLVGDNSFFGLTSPLAGHRFRLSAEYAVGMDDYASINLDARKYFWMKPFSLALRASSFNRFVRESNTIYPYYIGNMGFVRGYGSLFNNSVGDELQVPFAQLIGSKMALTSAEIRMPFTGPKSLALIGTNVLLTDLALFFDAGVAFDSFNDFSEGRNIDGRTLKPQIVSSAGVSLRVNLFGAMILEPHVAWPLRRGSGASFGLNFIPGW